MFGSKSFFALFLTVASLFFTRFLFLDSMFKITVETTAKNGKIEISYKDAAGTARSASARVVKNGGASARIWANGITELHLLPPAGTKIINVKIAGDKKSVFDNADAPALQTFRPAAHFDFKIFLLLGFLYFCLWHTVVNGIKPFDDKVPAMMNMEFLRLVFTFGIVVYHLTERLDIVNDGWLGVEFFFVLSGFFMTLTFDPARSTYDFAKSKIIHFVPLLLLCAFLGKAKPVPVISNVLFLQSTGLSDDIVPPQSWFLAVLFWASLFYFYMMKICRVQSDRLIFALLTFFSYAACRHFGWDGMIGGVFSVRLLRGVAGIGLGYFTASLCQTLRERKPANRVFCTMAETVLTLYTAAIVFVKDACPENKIFAVVCFAGLILLFGINRGAVSRFFNRPFFAKISACAFSIYMTHWFLEIDVVLRWYKRFSFLQRHNGLVIAGTILLSWVLGVFVHKYVEKNATAFLKRKWK